MKNDILVHQGTFEGTYELSTPVNGHPSWISSTNAIWSDPEYPDWWLIGKLDDIGQIAGGIIATGMFLGQTKTYEWRYWKGSELKTPAEDDIMVECIARKGECCDRQKLVFHFMFYAMVQHTKQYTIKNKLLSSH